MILFQFIIISFDKTNESNKLFEGSLRLSLLRCRCINNISTLLNKAAEIENVSDQMKLSSEAKSRVKTFDRRHFPFSCQVDYTIFFSHDGAGKRDWLQRFSAGEREKTFLIHLPLRPRIKEIYFHLSLFFSSRFTST